MLDHLSQRYRMLHRDISPNNLMLIRPDAGQRAGLLIDFDYAALLDSTSSHSVSDGFRTVRLIDTSMF